MRFKITASVRDGDEWADLSTENGDDETFEMSISVIDRYLARIRVVLLAYHELAEEAPRDGE